jgi:hypothetical protein
LSSEQFKAINGQAILGGEFVNVTPMQNQSSVDNWRGPRLLFFTQGHAKPLSLPRRQRIVQQGFSAHMAQRSFKRT